MKPHRVLTILVVIAALLWATRVGAEASDHQHSTIVHSVKRGETLSSIAARYGSSVQAIVQANGLSGTTIYPGQTLVIPQGGATSNHIAQVTQGSPKPAASGGAARVHVVRAGDTLSGIAARYGTTVAALKSANGLASNTIYVGQSLTIPSAAAGSPSAAQQYLPVVGSVGPAACSGSYTVQPGDTLSAIAARCGVTVSDLRTLNGLTNSSVLRPGQVLVVSAIVPSQPTVEPASVAPQPTTTRVPVRSAPTYSNTP